MWLDDGEGLVVRAWVLVWDLCIALDWKGVVRWDVLFVVLDLSITLVFAAPFLNSWV